MNKSELIASAVALLAVAACGVLLIADGQARLKKEKPAIVTPDKLEIEGRTITAIKLDGARCIMVTTKSSTALSCDFTLAAP